MPTTFVLESEYTCITVYEIIHILLPSGRNEGGGGGRPGGLNPPPNVQESVQILEI